jgi:hypothetical protein
MRPDWPLGPINLPRNLPEIKRPGLNTHIPIGPGLRMSITVTQVLHLPTWYTQGQIYVFTFTLYSAILEYDYCETKDNDNSS